MVFAWTFLFISFGLLYCLLWWLLLLFLRIVRSLPCNLNMVSLCRNWFFKLLVFLELISFSIKRYWSLIFFKQTAEIYLLKELSLSFESIINVVFIFLVVIDEKPLPEVSFLSIATKRVELISADSKLINNWVIMTFKQCIIFFELLDKTVNQNRKVLRLIGYWGLK